jgi:hypothetical protein
MITSNIRNIIQRYRCGKLGWSRYFFIVTFTVPVTTFSAISNPVSSGIFVARLQGMLVS